MTTLELFKELERRKISDPKSIHRMRYINGEFRLSSQSLDEYLREMRSNVGLKNDKIRINPILIKIGKILGNYVRNRKKA